MRPSPSKCIENIDSRRNKPTPSGGWGTHWDQKNVWRFTPKIHILALHAEKPFLWWATHFAHHPLPRVGLGRPAQPPTHAIPHPGHRTFKKKKTLDPSPRGLFFFPMVICAGGGAGCWMPTQTTGGITATLRCGNFSSRGKVRRGGNRLGGKVRLGVGRHAVCHCQRGPRPPGDKTREGPGRDLAVRDGDHVSRQDGTAGRQAPRRSLQRAVFRVENKERPDRRTTMNWRRRARRKGGKKERKCPNMAKKQEINTMKITILITINNNK